MLHTQYLLRSPSHVLCKGCISFVAQSTTTSQRPLGIRGERHLCPGGRVYGSPWFLEKGLQRPEHLVELSIDWLACGVHRPLHQHTLLMSLTLTLAKWPSSGRSKPTSRNSSSPERTTLFCQADFHHRIDVAIKSLHLLEGKIVQRTVSGAGQTAGGEKNTSGTSSTVTGLASFTLPPKFTADLSIVGSTWESNKCIRPASCTC